jgi:hypothetical protein
MIVFIPSMVHRLAVFLLHLSFQGGGDDATCTFPGTVVQRLCNFRCLFFSIICGKLGYGTSFSQSRLQLVGLTHPESRPLPL